MVRRGSGIYLIEVNYEHENYWSVCMSVGSGSSRKCQSKLNAVCSNGAQLAGSPSFHLGTFRPTDLGRYTHLFMLLYCWCTMLLCGWPTSIGSVTCGGRWHNRNPSVSGWMNVCPCYNNHNDLIGIIESTDSHRKSTPSLWYVFCCCSSCTIPIDHTTTNILFLVVLCFFLLCPSLSLRNLT